MYEGTQKEMNLSLNSFSQQNTRNILSHGGINYGKSRP